MVSGAQFPSLRRLLFLRWRRTRWIHWRLTLGRSLRHWRG